MSRAVLSYNAADITIVLGRYLSADENMRAVIQRVASACVEVDGRVIGRIKRGLLVYLSIGRPDVDKDAEFMAEKLARLRIFADEADKMNRSIEETGGELLLVSNFTLHGDCRKGRRPGFDAAAEPANAERLYDKTAQLLADKGVSVSKGIFGDNMQVTSVNDGPVTLLLDSSRLF